MKKINLIFAFCLCSICAFGQLIDNGPKLLITDGMKYEELYQALNQAKAFDWRVGGLCQCNILKKENPDILKILEKDLPEFVKDPNLSYKEKKAKLIKEYALVIKYIKDFYSLPLAQLEAKHLSEIKFYGTSGYCCMWHGRALAQRGSAKAQYAVGARLIEEINRENAIWLQLAGAQGITDAYYVLGQASYKYKVYEKAAEWFKIGAEAGDAKCMYSLGYEICVVLLKDAKIALPWFEKAAKKGHYSAIQTCAEIYSGEAYHQFNFVLCEERPATNYSLAIKYYLQLIEIEKRDKEAEFENRIANYKKIIKELQLKVED